MPENKEEVKDEKKSGSIFWIIISLFCSFDIAYGVVFKKDETAINCFMVALVAGGLFWAMNQIFALVNNFKN
jgi:hypothetical protein